LPTLLATWKPSFCATPRFWAFSALSAASYGGLFTFLAASSFVFTGVLGSESKTQYGLVMFVNSVAYIGGTFVCRYWIARLGVRRSCGAWPADCPLSGGTLMAVVKPAAAGISVWSILLPQMLFMIGHGVHQPCGQSGAVGPFPQAAGAASAVNGFLMMLCAFGMGFWLGTHMDGTVLPLTLGVWFWSALIAASAWTLVQRHGG
jgi:DHA1 family bicyclomycin/chloramphenicol resistance-like MFS transporter